MRLIKNSSIFFASLIVLVVMIMFVDPDAGYSQTTINPQANEPNRIVYLHYDYMVKEGEDAHSHAPNPRSIQLVVEAFRRHGLTLHIDPRHTEIPERRVVTFVTNGPPNWLLDTACAGDDSVPMHDLANRYFRPHENHRWHYAVFGHSNTCPDEAHCGFCPADPETGITPDPTSLGSAEVGNIATGRGGNDFIVSLGVFRDFGVPVPVESEAATFMHELGHNLGLFHGGYDAFNLKPNYLSVMNFSFSSIGIPVADSPGSNVPKSCISDRECPSDAFCSSMPFGLTNLRYCTRVDYSDRELPPLDEMDLNENVGIRGVSNNADITIYYNHILLTLLAPSDGPIDWDNDGDFTESHVVSDVNGDRFLTTLSGSNDWAFLHWYLNSPGYGYSAGWFDARVRLPTPCNEERLAETCVAQELSPADAPKDDSIGGGSVSSPRADVARRSAAHRNPGADSRDLPYQRTTELFARYSMSR